MCLFTVNIRSKNLGQLGVPDIGIVSIPRAKTSVSYMTNDDIHTLQRYEENLREYGSMRPHWNQCKVCYGHRKCTLSRFSG